MKKPSKQTFGGFFIYHQFMSLNKFYVTQLLKLTKFAVSIGLT